MFASANALWQLLYQVGQVAGPAIAGLLLAQVGIASVYWIDMATFTVSLLAVASLPSLRPPGGGTRFGLRSIAEGLGYLKGKPVLQGTFVVDLNAMILGMPRALFPALALVRFHGGRHDGRVSLFGPRRRGTARRPSHRLGGHGQKARDAQSSSRSRSGGRPSPPSGSFPSCSPLWCCSRSRVRPTSSRQCSGARSCNSRHPKPCGDDSRRCTPRLSPVDPDSVTSRQARWHLCRPRRSRSSPAGSGVSSASAS